MQYLSAMPKKESGPPLLTASAAIDDGRAAVSAWIEEIIERRKLTPEMIAEAAGVHVSTIYRAKKGNHSPSLGTISRVCVALGEEAPSGFGGVTAPRPVGLQEDAAPWTGAAPALLPLENPNHSIWIVRSRALELAGVMPGDLARLDQSARARPGDLVVAQIYDFDSNTALTRLRYFDGFSLVTRTMDPSLTERALPVDGERVVVMGRIDRVLRKLD